MNTRHGSWLVGLVLAATTCATMTLGTTSGAAASLSPAVRTTAYSAAHAAKHPTVTLPPANGRFDYQIGGDYKPLASVKIVDRDSTGKPAPGRYNICYINAFQTQAYQDAWWKSHHANLLLHTSNGKLVEDPGWPGEVILDTSTAAKRSKLAKIEDGWMQGCATKGFNAIEPDNLDSNTRSRGLLTQAEDFAFAKLLISGAHEDGLAIAQKNDAEQSARGKKLGFDFAIAEECEVYSECSYYLRAYDNEVYEIEYTDNPMHFYTDACADHGSRISIILRDRNVVPRGHPAYRYRAC